MKARTFGLVAASSLAVMACGGTNSGDENQNLVETNVTAETMGENGVMMNDMTTANDLAIGNEM